MMEALSFRRVVANRINLKEASSSSSPVRVGDRPLTNDGILINIISGITAIQNAS
jgi:hypothetical protein